MYKGFILSESLSDATALNDFKKIYVKVEKHDDPKYPKYWHLFKLTVPDDNIDKAVDVVSKNIKDEWYAHFWNDNKLVVIFKGKIFWIKREDKWPSDEYNKVVDYATSHCIDKRYLDFKIEE